MNSPLLAPLAALALTGFVCTQYALSQQRAITVKQKEVQSQESTLRALNDSLAAKRKEITDNSSDLAVARDFIMAWEASYSRAIRTSPETIISDAANTSEVSIPSPRIGSPESVAEIDGTRVMARQITTTAEGPLGSLIHYLYEIERSFPLSVTNHINIRAGDREPKMEMSFAFISQNFAPFPEIDIQSGNQAPAGVLLLRPTPIKYTDLGLAANIMARSINRDLRAQSKEAAVSLLEGLRITARYWHKDRKHRILMANGRMLMENQPIPSSLVKGSALVTLTEIARDYILVKISTEEVNPLTGKTETTTKDERIPYQIFPAVKNEG